MYFLDSLVHVQLFTASRLLTVINNEVTYTCDVICEKGPYGGTKRTGFDQTPRVPCGV